MFLSCMVENLAVKYKNSLWFSSQEINTFKYRAGTMAKKLSLSNTTIDQYAELIINDTSAFMGLESYLTKDLYQEIWRRRKSILWAIKLEQQRQWDIGIDDPDSLAIVSRALSEKAVQRASMIGILHDDIVYA
mmetsp:Transcript_26599/g.45406  ORF Transcript_26599/g.45406 Transcript_26599/m.45406 type:complete len:133 (+) Transcript_26599:189-587(+)